MIDSSNPEPNRKPTCQLYPKSATTSEHTLQQRISSTTAVNVEQQGTLSQGPINSVGIDMLPESLRYDKVKMLQFDVFSLHIQFNVSCRTSAEYGLKISRSLSKCLVSVEKIRNNSVNGLG